MTKTNYFTVDDERTEFAVLRFRSNGRCKFGWPSPRFRPEPICKTTAPHVKTHLHIPLRMRASINSEQRIFRVNRNCLIVNRSTQHTACVCRYPLVHAFSLLVFLHADSHFVLLFVKLSIIQLMETAGVKVCRLFSKNSPKFATRRSMLGSKNN